MQMQQQGMNAPGLPGQRPFARAGLEADEPDTYVSRVVKYGVFIFNFLFWLIGIALIGIGAWAYSEKQAFEGKTDVTSLYDIIFDASLVVISLGVGIFVLAFAGCTGALRDNISLLRFFSYSLGAIFLIEIIGATLIFVFSKQVKKKFANIMKTQVITRYREDVDLQNLIDWFQRTFECCGMSESGFYDWSLNPYFNCSDLNKSAERCGVPYSCCIKSNNVDEKVINTMCGYGAQKLTFVEAYKQIHPKGCLVAVEQWAENNMFLIGGVAIGFALPQLLGIFFSRILSNQIEDQRDRWLL